MKNQKYQPFILQEYKFILRHPFHLKKVGLISFTNGPVFLKLLPVIEKTIIKPVIVPLKKLSCEFGVNKYLLMFALVFFVVGLVVYFVS